MNNYQTELYLPTAIIEIMSITTEWTEEELASFKELQLKNIKIYALGGLHRKQYANYLNVTSDMAYYITQSVQQTNSKPLTELSKKLDEKNLITYKDFKLDKKVLQDFLVFVAKLTVVVFLIMFTVAMLIANVYDTLFKILK